MITHIDNRYRILKFLGEGGMGKVYLVADEVKENRTIALKTIQSNNITPELILHFKNEFQLLTRLNHPNLCEVYDFGFWERSRKKALPIEPQPVEEIKSDGIYYFTTEFVDGSDLAEACEHLTEDELYPLIVQISQALSYLHSRQCIHHDVKPSNILVTSDGRVKLTDLGLAKEHDISGGMHIRGTLGYIAPEIIRGDGVDPRADLYSLGATLYHVIAHELPFPGKNAVEILRKHLIEPPTPLIEKVPSIRPQLSELVNRLLAKYPSERYASANAVIRAINAVTDMSFSIDSRELTSSYILSGKFVGRDAEFTELKAGLEQTISESTARLFAVSGAAGIGKSRLLMEFRYHVQLNGIQYVEGVCYEDRVKTYHPFQRIVRALLAFATAEETAKYGPELVKLVPEMTETRQVKASDALPPQEEHDRLIHEVSAFILDVVTRQPVVLIIQDWHWADDGSVDLLTQLIRLMSLRLEKGEPTHLFLCLAAQPGDSPKHPLTVILREMASLQDYLKHLALEALLPEAVKALVQSMFNMNAADVPDFFLDKLMAESNGNPLFVEALMQAVIDQKALTFQNERWQFDVKNLAALKLPDTIAAALHEQFGHLPKDERCLLNLLAVMDRPASLRILENLAARFTEQIGQRPLLEILQSLQNHKFVKWTDSLCQITQNQTQHLAYAEISPADRAVYHRAVFETLDHLHHDRDYYVDELGLHAYEAQLWDQALHYLLLAGEKNMHLSAPKNAIDRYEKALEILTRKPGHEQETLKKIYRQLADLYEMTAAYDKRIKTLENWLKLSDDLQEQSAIYRFLSHTFGLLGKTEVALQYINKAEKLAAKHPETIEAAKVYRMSGNFHLDKGAYDEADAAYHKSLRIYEKLAHVEGTADIYYSFGFLYDRRSESKKALDYFEQSLALYQQLESKRYVGRCYTRLGAIYATMPGSSSQALECYERSLQISHELGDIRGEGNSLNQLGVYYANAGNLQKSLEYYQRCLDIEREAGDADMGGVVANNMGTIYQSLYDFETAQKYYKKAIDLYRLIQTPGREHASLQNLGLLYQKQHHYEDALTCYEDGLRMSQESNNVPEIARGLLHVGLLKMELQRYDEARARLEECLSLSQTKELYYYIAVDACVGLAQIERRRREYAKALDYCQKAEDFAARLDPDANVVHFEIVIDLNKEKALIYEWQGDYEKALLTYESILRTVDKAEKDFEPGFIFINSGQFYLTIYQLTRSQHCFQKALDFYNRSDKITYQALCYHGFGRIAHVRGDLESALKHYKHALSVDTPLLAPEHKIQILINMAQAHLEAAQYDETIRTVDHAQTKLSELLPPHYQANLWLAKGLALSKMEADADSRSLLNQVVALLPQIDDREALWKIYLDLANEESEKSEFTSALNNLVRAEEIVKSLSKSLQNPGYENTYLSQRYRNAIYAKFANLSNYAWVEGAGFRPEPVEHTDPAAKATSVLADLQIFLDNTSQSHEEKFKIVQLKLNELADLHQAISTQGREGLAGSGAYFSEMMEIIQILNSSLVLNELLVKIVDLAIRFVQATRGCLLLYDGSEKLEPRIVRNKQGEDLLPNLISGQYQLSFTVINRVLKTKEPLFVSNIFNEEKLLEQRSVANMGLCSVMAIPLGRRLIRTGENPEPVPGKDDLLGILYVDSIHVSEEARFNGEGLSLLQALADQAAVALVNAMLYEKSNVDTLTQLYLRPYFEEQLRAEIETVKKFGGSSAAILVLDIKGFKRISYENGRQKSDQLLRETAQLIKRNARAKDVCSRLSGDTFAVLLPEMTLEPAIEYARKILASITGHSFSLSQPVIKIGLALYPDHIPNLPSESSPTDEMDMLLTHAEQALYHAKVSETHPLMVWHPALIEEQPHRPVVPDILTGNPLRDYQNVEMLLEAIEVAHSTLDLDELLTRIADITLEISGAERCLLMLEDEKLSQSKSKIRPLTIRVARAKNKTNLTGQLDYSRSIPENVMQTGQPACVKEVGEIDPTKSMLDLELRSVMCVALEVKANRFGVIYVDSHLDMGEFSQSDMKFLDAVAHQIASVIENAQLHRRQLELEAEKVRKLEAEKQQLKTLLEDKRKIVGNCPAMQKVLDSIRKVSNSDATVLIYGESGTGKESVAHSIHDMSVRKNAPYIVIDCGAIPENLIESELFGHEKGSFTGAHAQKIGKFEAGHTGTVFLDEVGELPLHLQVKLLRVLQESEIQRVGGKMPVKIDVRIIAATNRHLEEMVEARQFRKDLFYRLNIIQIEMPPLRDRGGDIPLLANFYLNKFKAETGKTIRGFTDEAIKALQKYQWPGNVRELEHKVERAVIMSDHPWLSAEDLSIKTGGTDASARYKTLKEAKYEMETRLIKNGLERFEGSVTNTAEALGISRVRLHQLIDKYKIGKAGEGRAAPGDDDDD